MAEGNILKEAINIFERSNWTVKTRSDKQAQLQKAKAGFPTPWAVIVMIVFSWLGFAAVVLVRLAAGYEKVLLNARPDGQLEVTSKKGKEVTNNPFDLAGLAGSVNSGLDWMYIIAIGVAAGLANTVMLRVFF
jgi:hypothetical protein